MPTKANYMLAAVVAIVALAAAAVGIGIAAKASGDAAAPATQTPAASAPAPAPAPAVEAVDTDQFGRDVCEIISGYGPNIGIKLLVDNGADVGMSERSVVVLISIAVNEYCPELNDAIAAAS